MDKREKAHKLVRNYGMSYAAAARELGVSASTVRRWLLQHMSGYASRNTFVPASIDYTEVGIAIVDANGVEFRRPIILIDNNPVNRIVTDFSIRTSVRRG